MPLVRMLTLVSERMLAAPSCATLPSAVGKCWASSTMDCDLVLQVRLNCQSSCVPVAEHLARGLLLLLGRPRTSSTWPPISRPPLRKSVRH